MGQFQFSSHPADTALGLSFTSHLSLKHPARAPSRLPACARSSSEHPCPAGPRSPLTERFLRRRRSQNKVTACPSRLQPCAGAHSSVTTLPVPPSAEHSFPWHRQPAHSYTSTCCGCPLLSLAVPWPTPAHHPAGRGPSGMTSLEPGTQAGIAKPQNCKE